MRKRRVESDAESAMPPELVSFDVAAWTDLPEAEPAWWAVQRQAMAGSTSAPTWREHRTFVAAFAHQRAVAEWRRANGLRVWQPGVVVDR